MIFDYCEQDNVDGATHLHIGLQFEDEPDSLYVAELQLGQDGFVIEWQLYYNGVDCKYVFRLEEKQAIVGYVAEQGVEIQFNV